MMRSGIAMSQCSVSGHGQRSRSPSGSEDFSPLGPSPGEPGNKGTFFPKKVRMGDWAQGE